MSVGISSSLSSYDQMQAWSSQRAAAQQSYESNTATLTSALSGTSSTIDTLSSMLNGGTTTTSTFISNDALSTSLFGGVADTLTSQENLMAQVISTRIANQQYAQIAAQQAEMDAALSQYSSLA